MTSNIHEQLRFTYDLVRLCVVLLFAASFLFAGTSLISTEGSQRYLDTYQRLARVSYLVGSFLLGALLVLAVFQPAASLPILVNVGVSGIVAVFALSLERMRPAGSMGLSFLSAAVIWLLNVVTPYLFPLEQKTAWMSTSNVLWVHVVTAIGGYGTCVIAFLTSFVYLWNHHRLKARSLSKPLLGPSLDTLDRLTRRTTLLGLLLLTLSLVSGLFLVSGSQSAPVVGAPKVVWAFATWTFYVLLIFGRSFWNWHGRAAARLTVLGTVLVFAGLFGSFA